MFRRIGKEDPIMANNFLSESVVSNLRLISVDVCLTINFIHRGLLTTFHTLWDNKIVHQVILVRNIYGFIGDWIVGNFARYPIEITFFFHN